jgi:hypothetical protein
MKNNSHKPTEQVVLLRDILPGDQLKYKWPTGDGRAKAFRSTVLEVRPRDDAPLAPDLVLRTHSAREGTSTEVVAADDLVDVMVTRQQVFKCQKHPPETRDSPPPAPPIDNLDHTAGVFLDDEEFAAIIQDFFPFIDEKEDAPCSLDSPIAADALDDDAKWYAHTNTEDSKKEPTPEPPVPRPSTTDAPSFPRFTVASMLT